MMGKISRKSTNRPFSRLCLAEEEEKHQGMMGRTNSNSSKQTIQQVTPGWWKKSQPDGYNHQEQHQQNNQQVTLGLQTHHSVMGRICRNRLFSRSIWLTIKKSIPRKSDKSLIRRSCIVAKANHSMMGRQQTSQQVMLYHWQALP